MMANFEIAKCIALLQRLIDKFIISSNSVCKDANKKIKKNKKSGLHFCFLFLNWKVLSSKTVTVFF